jgi:hypothetical protein
LVDVIEATIEIARENSLSLLTVRLTMRLPYTQPWLMKPHVLTAFRMSLTASWRGPWPREGEWQAAGSVQETLQPSAATTGADGS